MKKSRPDPDSPRRCGNGDRSAPGRGLRRHRCRRDDPGRQHFDIAGHADDGGNAEAGAGPDEDEQAAGEDARCHQRQRHIPQDTERRGPGNAGSFFQGRIHLFHGPGNRDEGEGRIEQRQHPDEPAFGIDIEGCRGKRKEGLEQFIQVPHIRVQELRPGNGPDIRGDHIAGHQDRPEIFPSRQVRPADQPGHRKSDEYTEDHDKNGDPGCIGQRLQVDALAVNSGITADIKLPVHDDTVVNQYT